MTTAHWSPPDICGDLLAEALRPDAAEPVAIHIRPGLHALICRQSESTGAALIGGGTTGHRSEIRLVVDERLPAAPGYEIHRAVPRARAGSSDPSLPTR